MISKTRFVISSNQNACRVCLHAGSHRRIGISHLIAPENAVEENNNSQKKANPKQMHAIKPSNQIISSNRSPSQDQNQNFSIKLRLTVHILPLLPQIYIGIVVSKQAS